MFLEQQGEVVQDGVEGGPDNQQCSNAVAKVGDNDGRDEEDLHRLLSEKGDVHGVDHFDVDDSGCCVDRPEVGAIKVLRRSANFRTFNEGTIRIATADRLYGRVFALY